MEQNFWDPLDRIRWSGCATGSEKRIYLEIAAILWGRLILDNYLEIHLDIYLEIAGPLVVPPEVKNESI